MAIATDTEVSLEQRDREREQVRGSETPFAVFADARTHAGRIIYRAMSFKKAVFVAERNSRSVIYSTDLAATLTAR